MAKYNKPLKDLPEIFWGNEADRCNHAISKELLLPRRSGPMYHSGSFVFGFPEQNVGSLVGLQPGAEGNAVIVGNNGSGKTFGIAVPTLNSLEGSAIVTDIKGVRPDRVQ